jgi:hypothetical protein
MKKINSARKRTLPKTYTLPRSVILYGMGGDSPEQYVFTPRETFLDEFKTPTPAYITKAMLRLILERKCEEV